MAKRTKPFPLVPYIGSFTMGRTKFFTYLAHKSGFLSKFAAETDKMLKINNYNGIQFQRNREKMAEKVG